MFSAAAIITTLGGYSVSRSCEWLDHNIPETDRMLELYPVCSTWLSGENPSQRAVVDAKWATHASSGAEVIASLSAPFGMAIWLAFTLHAFGVEIYVSQTSCMSTHRRGTNVHSSCVLPQVRQKDSEKCRIKDNWPLV